MENKAAFATLMLNASLEAYHTILQKAEHSLVFFDRGIPDTIGYMELENIPVPPKLNKLYTHILTIQMYFYFRHGKVFTKQITNVNKTGSKL
jgi:predicted ATPase